MDELEAKLDSIGAAAVQGPAPTDGPGNPAYQRMTAGLMRLHAQIAAERRN